MSRDTAHFELATVGRIVFGRGCCAQVGAVVAGLGRRAALVTGKDRARATQLVATLEASGVSVVCRVAVSFEPTVQRVLTAVTEVRASGADCVVALGGGSAINAAKAIAVLVTSPGDVLDYLEVVGQGLPLERPGLPVIALPTTAGTGAEVTRNAVLAVPEARVKVSLRSPFCLAKVALIDPELTVSMPKALTAATGLDALTQLLETFVCRTPSPFVDGFCREGLARIRRSLLRAYRDGADADARQDMSFAALLSGLALAHAPLGAVHGLAGPLGGMFPNAPHGAVCGRLLPAVVAANLSALRARAPHALALDRYTEAAAILTGRPCTAAEELVAWLDERLVTLAVPRLATYGVTPANYPALATAARRASSMQGNPIELAEAEIVQILERAEGA